MVPSVMIARAGAVADPTRLRILFHLADGPRSVGDLGSAVGISSSAVTYHLGKLLNAGLVVAERRGRRTLVRRVERRWAPLEWAFGTGE